MLLLCNCSDLFLPDCHEHPIDSTSPRVQATGLVVWCLAPQAFADASKRKIQ